MHWDVAWCGPQRYRQKKLQAAAVYLIRKRRLPPSSHWSHTPCLCFSRLIRESRENELQYPVTQSDSSEMPAVRSHCHICIRQTIGVRIHSFIHSSGKLLKRHAFDTPSTTAGQLGLGDGNISRFTATSTRRNNLCIGVRGILPLSLC
jgi:hypothetical protein